MEPKEADVFLIAGYLHLAGYRQEATGYAKLLMKRLYNKTKPHIALTPTWNEEKSLRAGIADLIVTLKEGGVNLWSVGFERNEKWQHINANRIIPIPYVMRPSYPKEQLQSKARSSKRTRDFLFYAGAARKHTVTWGGCNRTMVAPLQNISTMDVSIRDDDSRLSQKEYNNRMFTSDYCLILCGDTVTSRSLTSSIVYGCIPVRVGSRLRGLCEPPCHKGWGWTISGADCPHLPFSHSMDWDSYPEVSEANFSVAPLATLQDMFRSVSSSKREKIRENILRAQMGWIYGWGDPVTSQDFGEATEYVWKSIVSALGLEGS